MSVGIEEMPAAPARARSASVSTLRNVTSWCFSEAFSKTGANMRHGPHQAAQKSTSTMSFSSTRFWKVSPVALMVAMGRLLAS